MELKNRRRPDPLLFRRTPEAPTWGATVGLALWLGPSPAGYLFQNPGHAVKQHSEEVPLKERPLRLVGVQRCESQGPAPGTDAGAALLELEQEGELRGGPRSGGPGTQRATQEGGLRASWLELGVPWRSSQREKPLRGKEWALAEASTLTSV